MQDIICYKTFMNIHKLSPVITTRG